MSVLGMTVAVGSSGTWDGDCDPKFGAFASLVGGRAPAVHELPAPSPKVLSLGEGKKWFYRSVFQNQGHQLASPPSLCNPVRAILW